MIFDSTNLFSDAQAITATAASTNVLDLGAVGTPVHGAAPVPRDFGKGHEKDLRIQVVETFATLTSLTVSVEGSVDAAFTSPVTLQTSPAIPAASLVAGYWFKGLDDVDPGAIYRYMRVKYTVTGTNATAGKITAGLVFDNDEAWPRT